MNEGHVLFLTFNQTLILCNSSLTVKLCKFFIYLLHPSLLPGSTNVTNVNHKDITFMSPSQCIWSQVPLNHDMESSASSFSKLATFLKTFPETRIYEMSFPSL